MPIKRPLRRRALVNHHNYTSRDSVDKHTKTKNLKALIDAAEKDGVFGRLPYLVFQKITGGDD